MKILSLILVLGSILLAGCPNRGGCSKSITVFFSGKVVDNNGNPLQDVELKISTGGSEPSEFVKTDVNGNYEFSWFRAAPLHNVYLVFTKSGFTEFTSDTEQLGENCSDDRMEVNVTLSP